jgi:hypothetical protein
VTATQHQRNVAVYQSNAIRTGPAFPKSGALRFVIGSTEDLTGKSQARLEIRSRLAHA